MHDWFVTVLVSIRDMAAKSGMVALAEEMDIAILVAANEGHEREMSDLGKVDVRATEQDPRTDGRAAEPGGLRRYH
ncbi:MAG: hypothetical protein AAGK00_18945 [Pseudomonadota bacterium]